MIVTQINILTEGILGSQACMDILAQTTQAMDVTSQPVSNPPDYRYFLMNLLSLSSLCLILITGGLIIRHFSRQKRAREALNILSGKAQLTAEQIALIREFYDLTGVSEINDLFDDEEIFRQAVAIHMSRLRKAGLDEEGQAKAIGMLQDLYLQMDFKTPSCQSARNFLSTCQFLPGEKIFLSPADGSEDIPASIIRNDVKGLVLDVKLKSAVKPGQWRSSFADHGFLWEFLSTIEALSDGRLVMRHCDNLRMLNRRLFPRIPTNRPGLVANFSLTQPIADARIPEFVSCRVVELAGPGLKILCDAKFEINQRVLLLVELSPGAVTGGPGKVRRTVQEETGKYCFVVELVGMDENELSNLTCITNEISRSKLAKEE